jgi:16S rRNA (cytosine1402-N4)-methyltransferase
MREYHVPVMAGEVVRLLDPHPGQTYVDGTAGGGGHSALIAERIAPNGRLIVVDQDLEALEAVKKRFRRLSPKITAIHGNFRDLANLLDAHGISQVHGILFDLGVSSHQFDTGERGFSFRVDAPLDLRMDPSRGIPGYEVLARLSQDELKRILFQYGGERWSARIAQFIKNAASPIETTLALGDVIKAAIPKKAWPKVIHPATRTFQALRIYVNDEIGALGAGLEAGIRRLASKGRIVVLSYHSLEDRVVKQTFLKYSGRCQCPPGVPVCNCGAARILEVLTRRPVTPEIQEIERNPRARSAKLRAAERV